MSLLGKASRIVVPLIVLFGAVTANAACLESPAPALHDLVALVGRDPHAVLRKIEALLASANASGPGAAQTAWLHAIQADAYSYLSRPEEARAVARQGLNLVANSHDAVHTELLVQYAESSFKPAEMDEVIPALNSERRMQTPGSAADICLQGTLGDLQKLRGLSGPAVANLTEAYRASMRPETAVQRIFVAVPLYKVMKAAGDYAEALLINQEVIDWDRRHGRTLSLSVDLYDRARILLAQEKYEAALELLVQSQQLSAPLGDNVGNAYIDLYSCGALMNLGKLSEAETRCLSADHVFSLNKDDGLGQAELFLSRIALDHGDAQRALELLNAIFDKGIAENAVVSEVRAYELRAQAYAALNEPAAAYADLTKYVQLYKQWNDAERTNQTAILRARFESDSQTARNNELRRELEFSEEREHDQLRRTLTVIACATIVIALLCYIALLGRFHQTKLMQLAHYDVLTGLLNRRRTTERSTALLRSGNHVRPLTVALLDLDHFKDVNDTFGHAAGDQVLQAFSEAARGVVRSSDVLGRWGGEEFLLVLPNTAPDAGSEILDRLRSAAEAIRLPFSSELRIRFSAGIAADVASLPDLDEIVNRADTALYKAKSQSRNTTCIDDRSLQIAPTTHVEQANSGAKFIERLRIKEIDLFHRAVQIMRK